MIARQIIALPTMARLLWPFWPLTLAQSHSGTAAVLIDEFDARLFECPPQDRRRCTPGLCSHWPQFAGQLEQGQVDLITLDIGLGEDDGLQLARETRTLANVPALIITGYAAPIELGPWTRTWRRRL